MSLTCFISWSGKEIEADVVSPPIPGLHNQVDDTHSSFRFYVVNMLPPSDGCVFMLMTRFVSLKELLSLGLSRYIRCEHTKAVGQKRREGVLCIV